jgi:hypothetical protein
MSSSNGKDNSGPARTRYWLKHDKPARGIQSLPNMQKRIRASDYSLLQSIVSLGQRSDAAVRYAKPSDLVRNRAFVEHQQKLHGALGRLARIQRGSPHSRDQVAVNKTTGVYTMATGSTQIPHRAELDGLKSAFKTLDVKHYPPCGKVARCRLYDGHIGDCKEE